MQQLSMPDRAIAVQNRAGAVLSRISPQAESGILDSLVGLSNILDKKFGRRAPAEGPHG